MRPSAVAKLGLITGFTVAPVAAADDEASPWLQIDVPIEAQFDATVSPSAVTLSDLYLTIEPSVAVKATDWLSLEFGMVFEPIADATDDRAFEDHGLYLYAAEVVASAGSASFHLGKFSPNFSIGFALTPGLNGDTFNADAEIAERVGLRGSYSLDGEGTAEGVIVSAAVFRRDTSVFSDSLFKRRGRLHVADGGPGNHSGLESVALALDVIKPAWAPGLHAHAAVLQQQAGTGDPVDAKAWVVGVHWAVGDSDDAQYQLIAEWARSEDAIGFGDAVSAVGASQNLLTLGVAGTWVDLWTASIVYGQRDTDDPLTGEANEWFAQLTLGYFVTDDLSAEVGWQKYDDGVEAFDIVSLRIASGFEYAASN